VTVTDSATKHTLYEGDSLEVTADGPAGGRATANIEHRIVFPLTEVSAGHYVGVYDVQRVDYLLGAPVRVRITMPNGNVFGNHSSNIVKVFGQMFTVRVISPENGSKVAYNFTIKGRTRPKSRVSISPTFGAGTAYGGGYNNTGQPPMPGQIHRNLGGVDVYADEHGYFEWRFGFPVHIVNVGYTFMLTATDPKGEQAIPGSLYVTMTSKPDNSKVNSNKPDEAPHHDTNKDGPNNY